MAILPVPSPARSTETVVPIRPVEDRSAAVEALTPEVDTQVFRFQPDAQFWIGETAVGDSVRMPVEHLAIGQLRANVYVDETHFLPATVRQADGTEHDEDDGRSVHFVVIQNGHDVNGPTRAIGTARLIQKLTNEEPLPVEALFPEAFATNAAQVGSVEASRFISRHPNRLLQSMVSLSLVRTMVLRAEAENSPHIYAVVEGYLVRLFQKIGLPMDQLGEPKPLKEYNNTLNVPLRFTPTDILRTAEADVDNALLMSPFFRLPGPSQGLGFFDESLTRAPSDEPIAHL